MTKSLNMGYKVLNDLPPYISVISTPHHPPSPPTPHFLCALDILHCTKIPQHFYSHFWFHSRYLFSLVGSLFILWDPTSMSPRSTLMFTTSPNPTSIPFLDFQGIYASFVTVFITFIVIIRLVIKFHPQDYGRLNNSDLIQSPCVLTQILMGVRCTFAEQMNVWINQT